tara:strand:+ start:34065 stop:34343 length:279 start_codon:yes stop_codon:yes gene_type:complete
MTISVLTARARVLQDELQKANSNVQNLTAQLNQASAHLHTVHGHFNEVAYLLGEAQKEAGLIPAEAIEQHEACKEQDNVEAVEQSEGQAAQE